MGKAAKSSKKPSVPKRTPPGTNRADSFKGQVGDMTGAYGDLYKSYQDSKAQL
eukprot:gene44226-50220_t